MTIAVTDTGAVIKSWSVFAWRSSAMLRMVSTGTAKISIVTAPDRAEAKYG